MRFRTLAITLALHSSFYPCLAAPQRCIRDERRTGDGTMPDAAFTHACLWLASSSEPALPVSSELAIEDTFQTPSDTSFSSSLPCLPNIAAERPSPVSPPRSQMVIASRARSMELPLSSHLSFNIRLVAGDMEQRNYPRRRSEKVGHWHSVAIVFAILGSLMGMAALILCGRSVRDYCRMPRRDPAAEHIDRFHLERELAEIEEARLLRVEIVSGRAVLDCAPPAHQDIPRYEEAAKDVPPPFHGERQAD